MSSAGLLAAFVAETALVSYREFAGGGIQVPATAPISLPIPAAYTAPIIFYGALSLVPAGGGAARAASLIGWGIVVATLLNLWDPSSGKVKSQAPASAPIPAAGTPGGPSLVTPPGLPAGSLGPIGPLSH